MSKDDAWAQLGKQAALMMKQAQGVVPPFSAEAMNGLPAKDTSRWPTQDHVRSQFLRGAHNAGITNRYALAAIKSTGRRESQFSPHNVNRSWPDRSESGKPGTSGGVASWRDGRLDNMRQFAADLGYTNVIPPGVQGEFMAKEDPRFTRRINSATNALHAARLYDRQWRYAGWNRDSAERRERHRLSQESVPFIRRFFPERAQDR